MREPEGHSYPYSATTYAYSRLHPYRHPPYTSCSRPSHIHSGARPLTSSYQGSRANSHQQYKVRWRFKHRGQREPASLRRPPDFFRGADYLGSRHNL